MRPYYIASCSCGNDSTAMVWELIRRGYPLDEVVRYNNGADFRCIDRLWEKVKERCEPQGIKCTELKPQNDLFFDMCDRPKTKRTGEKVVGDGWCGGACRWGTFKKIQALNKYALEKNAIVYVGFAFDEPRRVEKLEYYKRSPLVEWGLTQADCLRINRENGIDWLEKTEAYLVDLYTILDRVSCWCCANKNQWELYNIWQYLPNYWEELRLLQEKIGKPFKGGKYGYTIHQLQERFENGYIPKHRTKKEKPE